MIIVMLVEKIYIELKRMKKNCVIVKYSLIW